MRVIFRRVCRGARDERGAVALIVAVSMTTLLVVTAMVLDFGLVRLDRQHAKSAADSAVMAGLRAADDRVSNQVYTFKGVCGALDFLKVNEDQLSGLPPGICATSANSGAKCDPANPTAAGTVAVYNGSVTSGGVTSSVTIKAPYSLSDGNFAEESYASVAGDTSQFNDCDQIGVVITQARKPGLGSLATTGDLMLRIRSVGRVANEAGDVAPAMILLERTRCQVLTNGSSGPGNDSKIWVYGSGSTPATIHVDSSATDSGCGSGSNQQLISGNKANGIVAFGATGSLSGSISSYATLSGAVAAGVVSDGSTNIFGTTALNEFGLPGTKSAVIGRGRIGRFSADKRYLDGVSSSAISARTQWLLNHLTPTGYTRFGCPDAADMSAMASMTSANSVYIDCPQNGGITLTGTIGAGTIYFHGFVQAGKLSMPNATTVYIDNTDNSDDIVKPSALSLGNNNGFCVRATLCDSVAVGTCASTSTTQAQLIVRRGSLESTGGLLRLCNTTVIMEGGQLGSGSAASPGGCLPINDGDLPTPTPCTGTSDSTAGNGHVSLSGGTDWTAPNRYANMTTLLMTPAQQQAAWDSGEDLALWTETYATSPTYKMAGGAALNVGGVFMVPNAFPITFTGSAVFDLREAQFITRSFAVDGGAQLIMEVDPNNAITYPKLGPFLLVR